MRHPGSIGAHTRPLAVATLLFTLPNACIVVNDSRDSAVAVVDLDSAHRANQVPPDSAALARAAAQLARDSASVKRMSDSVRAALARDSIAPVVAEQLPPDVTPAPGPSGPHDTASVNATPVELAALTAALIIPVQGIQARDLRDSYTEPRGGGSRSHEALDIPAPRGTPVLAAAAGRILRKYQSKDGGNMIYATDATEKFILMYAHLDRYADNLTDGMTVRRGDVIGYVGTTGNAPPDVPHLHFALARASDIRDWWRGTPINPFPLLASHGG
jgi:murein DD-endopeptidase MepM/ murein hydrolase activator NlpD